MTVDTQIMTMDELKRKDDAAWQRYKKVARDPCSSNNERRVAFAEALETTDLRLAAMEAGMK